MSKDEHQMHQMVQASDPRVVTHVNSPSGSKGKRKRSPPKNDTPSIHKGRGSESPPQAKFNVLEDSGSQGGELIAQSSSAIIPRQKIICKDVWRPLAGLTRGQAQQHHEAISSGKEGSGHEDKQNLPNI